MQDPVGTDFWNRNIAQSITQQMMNEQISKIDGRTMQRSLTHFLDTSLQTPRLHALWLSSLSYLEYVGYRKMVKALGYEELNAAVHQHLSDEIQHSFTLKQLKNESLGKDFDLSPHGLHQIKTVAEDYFQTLDQSIEQEINRTLEQPDPFLCYLWTSLIIEKRAMQVYPLYQSKLGPSPLRTALQQIIRDENSHLTHLQHHLQSSPAFEKNQEQLTAIETQLFGHYLNHMNQLFQANPDEIFQASAKALQKAVAL